MIRRPLCGFAFVAVFVAAAAAGRPGSGAHAAPILVNSFDSGWYEDDGHHDPSIQNYIAGKTATTSPGGSFTNRNWFAFNIPALATPIDSARLRLFNPLSGYESADPTETYALADVITPITTLRAGAAAGSANGLAIYNDLGSGVGYGTVVASAADNGQFIVIELNAAALAALNANRGGPLAIGGAITTLEDPVNRTEHLFAWTPGTAVAGNVTLELYIPEPGTSLLLGIATCGTLLTRRRRARG